MNKNRRILLSLIAAGFLIRMLLIWVGRPSFVGWFNHTYYYYVQTQSLLSEGTLAFADMPLLFYLYALTAKGMSFFGVELQQAIISATRFWMCLVPALIPLPIFYTLRRLKHSNPVQGLDWFFVGVAAFLPLSIAHLPEFSQKNMMGFLLLACLFAVSQAWVERRQLREALVSLLLFVLIVLTHFGSAAVAGLYGFALAISHVLHSAERRTLIPVLLGTLGLGVIALGMIYFFDAQRITRIGAYAATSFHSSHLGVMLGRGEQPGQALMGVLGTVIPALLFLGGIKLWTTLRPQLTPHAASFLLSLVMVCYLLLLPIYDQLLWARFALFVPLPLLLVLFFMVQEAVKRFWMKRLLVGAMVLGSALLAVGEAVGLQMQQRNQDQVFEELQAAAAAVQLGPQDLVLTKNGAEHIVNWFLGAKAGVITAFRPEDLSTYARVFILNPIQGRLDFRELEGLNADTEAHRYRFMLRNIPAPSTAVERYQSGAVQLLQLEKLPPEWEFRQGKFWSYTK